MIPPRSKRRESRSQRLLSLAERHPRRAAHLAKRWLGNSALDSVSMLAAGWALLRAEDLQCAEQVLQQAQSILAEEAGTQRTALLHCQRALLMLEQLRGVGEELQTQWETQIDVCLAAGDYLELVRARCEQIAHLNLLGRYAEAQTLAKAIETLVAHHGTPAEQARYGHVTAVADIGQSQLERGLHGLAQAQALFAQLGHRSEVARVHFERGWLYLRREELTEAKHELDQAQAIYQHFGLAYRVALCQRDQGTLAYRSGNYDEAIRLAIVARNQFLALDRADRVAGCDLNIGTVAHSSGLYDLALASYQRAAQIYEAYDDGFHALLAQRNQILVLCDQGQPQAALALADQIQPLQDDQQDRMGSAELRALRVKALRALQHYDEAFHEATLVAAEFRELENPKLAAEVEIDLGWIMLGQQQSFEAEHYFRRAIEALHEKPDFRWQAYYGLGQAAEQQTDVNAARAAYDEALRLFSQLRQRLASEYASSATFRIAQNLYHAALHLAAEQADSLALLILAEQQRGLALERSLSSDQAEQSSTLGSEIAQALKHLQTSLRNNNPVALNAAIDEYLRLLFYQRHTQPLPPLPPLHIDLDQIKARLNRAYQNDWSLLAPIITNRELLIVGLTPTTIELTRHPLNENLKHLIKRACEQNFRQLTYLAGNKNNAENAWRILQDFADYLVPAWLQERLHPNHRLLIIPSGPLHGLAWGALRQNETWLIERAIIELLPHLQVAGIRPTAQPIEPALLIACEDFGSRAQPLPIAPQTLDFIPFTPNATVTRLVGAQATIHSLQALNNSRALTNYRLLHIASHAQFGPINGLLAHIKLFDGDLLLEDLLQMKLKDALVVLSTCEGGMGAVLDGDEILSLSRGLLAIGAHTVVASRWKIYDVSVLALLKPFYRALALGADPASALADAQRQLINESNQQLLATPFLWANFCVTTGGGWMRGTTE